MTSTRFLQISGLFLCLAALCFLLDTLLDAFAPAISPGIGALVSVFGLAGMPGFWVSLGPQAQRPIALTAFFITMLGLAGLVVLMFIINRVLPDLGQAEIGGLLTAIKPELGVILSVFAFSGLLLAAALWPFPPRLRWTGVAYAIGAILIAATQILPPIASATGGILISGALASWGAGLLGRPCVPAAL